MKPLTDAAFRLIREQYEDQMESCRATITEQERKIKKLKNLLVYFTKLEKQLAKPPKPFKPLKLTKAQRKAMARMPVGPTNYDLPKPARIVS